jgi:hypothetical protein
LDREAVSVAEEAGLDVKNFLNASLVAWVRGTDAAIGEHLRDHVLVPKRLVESDKEGA